MLRKYNIALVPLSKNLDIINYAKFLSLFSYQYQLGENSLPHVTLCQFHTDTDSVQSLWNKVCETVTEHKTSLAFKDFSCTTSDNEIFWISLIPNQRTLLNEMHNAIVEIVNPPSKKAYDPHLTLINTKVSNCEKIADKLIKTYSPIADEFVLSIGECDEIGQFTKLLYKCDENNYW